MNYSNYKMLMQNKFLILLIVFLTPLIKIFAQKANILSKINIASPNSSSLGKYIDIPVNYHTGVPNIEIPIHTITTGNLKLPVSLSYHASGLKVDENDSWVGAGWTLNAGGAIMRTVKDKPDEKQTFNSNQTYGHYSDYGLSNYWAYKLFDESNIDNEPDLFFFNFNGYSGKFFFNDDRMPVLMPGQDLKIECSYTPGQWTHSPGAWAGYGRCIESFIITIPDGTKYYFGIPDPNHQTLNDPIEVSSTFTLLDGNSYSQVISSWYLYKIVSSGGNSVINLIYERDKYAFFTFTNAPTHSLGGSSISYKYALVKNLVSGVRLSKIIGSNQQVDFGQGESRQDLSRWETGLDENIVDAINVKAKTLGSITISSNNTCFKRYNFSYDYFSDDVTPLPSVFSFNIISDKKRLRLNSIQELSCNTDIVIPPYKFEYYSGLVPRKLSFARDHWGYNNGVLNNKQLYPKISGNNGVINNGNGLDIANRESSWPIMQAGTLKKITHPTGGFTSLIFEPNTVWIKENGINKEKIIGGLRIQGVSKYDPQSNQVNTSNYLYEGLVTGTSYLGATTKLSSGILYSIPTYIQIFRNDWIKKSNFFGLKSNASGCWDNAFPNAVYNHAIIFSDNPIRPMETTQGYHIGYDSVKVIQSGNGYSLYIFNGIEQTNRSNIAITHIDNPGPCNSLIPNFPPGPLPDNPNRGELLNEQYFNESGAILHEKKYENQYALDTKSTPGRITFSWTTSGTSWKVSTLYELRSYYKTSSSVNEITYQPGGTSIQNLTQTSYVSKYHHQPTQIVTSDSKGKSIKTDFKYAFDYRVTNFKNIESNCQVMNGENFLSYLDNKYYQTYQSKYYSCSDALGNVDANCIFSVDDEFTDLIYDSRKTYIDCRKINFTNPVNNFQTAHNTAKANADAKLKPYLWMQDVFMNSPVEISQFKDDKLLTASYQMFSNLKDDQYDIYPSKTTKIDLSAPSATFLKSDVSASGKSVTTDSRYKDFSSYNFNKGKLISITDRDGVPESYEWGYKENFPVVKIKNAINDVKAFLQQAVINDTAKFCFGDCSIIAHIDSIQLIFKQAKQGNIQLSIGTPPPNTKIEVTGTLKGPKDQPIKLCASGAGGVSCSAPKSSVTFANMPIGMDTINCTAIVTYSGFTFPFDYNFYYNYQGEKILTSGTKEFFYQGFEEFNETGTNNIANVVSGFAKTGNKYWDGSQNYIVPFAKPNNRAYVIQWSNLFDGTWQLKKQPYSNGMALTGLIDDVRVFPADAQMTTYTYQPLAGITSISDVNNKSTYYEYDNLSRLNIIKNANGKIIKKYHYAYLSPNADGGVACGLSNCVHEDEKCINGFCEKARRMNTSTILVKSGENAGRWKCFYYYEWSDKSTDPPNINDSQNPNPDRRSEYNTIPCDLHQP